MPEMRSGYRRLRVTWPWFRDIQCWREHKRVVGGICHNCGFRVEPRADSLGGGAQGIVVMPTDSADLISVDGLPTGLAASDDK